MLPWRIIVKSEKYFARHLKLKL